MKNRVKTALISVYDKTNILDLAKFLEKHNVEILSTGGTAELLKNSGIKTTEVSNYTKSPEILDGRVKTLHPKIHGGLLASLENPKHLEQMQANDIKPIELVIVNLYPFVETVKSGAPYADIIEKIDIGGPSMVRSAAKNHKYTTVVTDPHDYSKLMDYLIVNDFSTDLDFRTKMATKAFKLTAEYDLAVSQWFDLQALETFDKTVNIRKNLHSVLRYGENPHQKAAIYTGDGGFMDSTTKIQGKELSYNNICDSYAALQLVSEFKEPACAIIKHANPCGAALGANISEAYDKALACDPLSAFGGIIALNGEIDEKLAQKISSIFTEVIICKNISEAAKKIFAAKPNLRVLIYNENLQTHNNLEYKSIGNDLIIQEVDSGDIMLEDFKPAVDVSLTDAIINDMRFAMKVCKHVKSNAIVIVKDGATIGIGAGQMSRYDSVRMAILKAEDKEHTKMQLPGSILASDAFFPFTDGVEYAHNHGVSSVVQPGGSVNDEKVITFARDKDINMVLTNVRHFKH